MGSISKITDTQPLKATENANTARENIIKFVKSNSNEINTKSLQSLYINLQNYYKYNTSWMGHFCHMWEKIHQLAKTKPPERRCALKRANIALSTLKNCVELGKTKWKKGLIGDIYKNIKIDLPTMDVVKQSSNKITYYSWTGNEEIELKTQKTKN